MLVLLLALLTVPAFAYEVQYAGKAGSHPLKWPGGEIRMSVSSSMLEESPNLRGSDRVLSAIRRAAERWEAAAGVRIEFSVSDIGSISPKARRGDGISLITIAQTPENLLLFSGEGSQAAAFTRIFYDSDGTITEADIVLNPFFLTSTDGTPGSFDLESTVTHELGHVLGLGHSRVLGATMFENSARNGLYGMPFTSVRTLSGDDVAGVRSIYGAPYGDKNCCSEIRGAMTSSSGEKNSTSFEVWAVDVPSGRVAASVLTDDQGRYAIGGLEPAEYAVYARKLGGNGTVIRVDEIDLEKKEVVEFGPRSSSEVVSFSGEGVGFNGQLAGIAVPVNAGSAYRVMVSGKGINRGVVVSVASDYFTVEDDSVETINFGGGLYALSFIVQVEPGAKEGNYSIVLTDEKGRSDWVLGGLTVESIKNPWMIRDF